MNNIPQGGPESGRTYWTDTEYKEDNKNVWMIHLTFGQVADSLKMLTIKYGQ